MPKENSTLRTRLAGSLGSKLRGSLRVAGFGFLGTAGLAGAVAAIEHYHRHDIPRTGQEQRLSVQLDAPYGSVAVRPGTPATNVAVIEADGDQQDGPQLQFRYTIRNHSIGILRIGVGTDEGSLQQEPVVALWRANSGFSLARASSSQIQSDLGISTTAASYSLGLPPISPYSSLPPMRVIVTDAGTYVTEVPPPSSAANTRIFLTRDIPMDLSADLGFGESTVDLSGLQLQQLGLETGASKALVTVNQPNPVAMGVCHVSAGLGECTFNGISNLNASRFLFNGGVGSYHLGFEGKLTRNMDATVEVGLGRCTITIPAEAGRVQVLYDDNILSSYTFTGLATRRDGYATSVGFDRSNSPVLTLRLSSGMGKMTVVYR